MAEAKRQEIGETQRCQDVDVPLSRQPDPDCGCRFGPGSYPLRNAVVRRKHDSLGAPVPEMDRRLIGHFPIDVRQDGAQSRFVRLRRFGSLRV